MQCYNNRGKKTEGLSNMRDLSPLFKACCLLESQLSESQYSAGGVCSYTYISPPPLGNFLGTRNDKPATPSKYCPRAPARLHHGPLTGLFSSIVAYLLIILSH